MAEKGPGNQMLGSRPMKLSFGKAPKRKIDSSRTKDSRHTGHEHQLLKDPDKGILADGLPCYCFEVLNRGEELLCSS